jgi:hypothetical protein
MSFDPKVDLKTDVDGQGLATRVVCIPCCTPIFDLKPNASDSEKLIEGKSMAAHLEFAHDMVAFYGRCPDPNCRKFHLSAFHKGQVPPEIQALRNKG